VLYGGAGNDALQARDGGRDAIFCGTGFDTVVADAIDLIAPRECEQVATGPDGTTPPPPPVPAPATIDGTSGDDVLHGTPGPDTISGHAGNDRIYGLDGHDTIVGGSGHDLVYAGAGNDRIDVKDGEIDFVSCGLGIDTVTADRIDLLTRAECEVVLR
jgi:Ca2+-binding RTX toxin-like protein